ncbi:hypothetical protein JH268_04860 [Xanthomonas campestris pv. campestris]|uniref:hypothetical protein n=1 Tax=Xanthomonas campestris TaxID=339 RepID=UPI002378A77C|nr:hypothetical protein [Xanthomonas campestris]WDL22693.1 hypothetical protein JH268_04860 [Xanthomonas campestris pv. campestris]WDL59512.1 hypothetical protein JH303_04790 [Xanthomonas campestris pv. campestris]
MRKRTHALSWEFTTDPAGTAGVANARGDALLSCKKQKAKSKKQKAKSKKQTARGGGASAHPLRNATADHVAAPSSSNKDLVVIKIHARKPAIRSFSLQERCERDRLRNSTAHATCLAIDCAQFRITRACLHRIAQASPH